MVLVAMLWPSAAAFANGSHVWGCTSGSRQHCELRSTDSSPELDESSMLKCRLLMMCATRAIVRSARDVTGAQASCGHNSLVAMMP